MKLCRFLLACCLILSSPSIFAEYINSTLAIPGFDPNREVAPGETDPRKVAAVIANVDALLHTPNSPESGNPDGKVTLIEFFDYRCAHCIATNPTVMAVMKVNKDLRVIYKEFPLSSGLSTFAAKAALAANMQQRYFVFHDALMHRAGNLTEEKILASAQECGLDLQKLKVDMASKAVSDALDANYRLAQALRISGTPVLIGAPSALHDKNNAAGTFFIMGAPDYIYLQNMISKIKTT